MKLPVYIGLLDEAEATLAASFRVVADGHGDEPDVHFILQTLAQQCDAHREALQPVIDRYGEEVEGEEEHRLTANGVTGVRSGPLALMLDLQDLYVLVHHIDVTWMMVGQAAQGDRDKELQAVVKQCEGDSELQIRWLKTRMKQAAPQALLVAE
ncbi:hypothetical protein B1A87_018910 [Arthrobacter sp. KBS0703]|jgi:hypothetical protein|uniref:hypothetical protein n=1 Tax=Bacteria TaxID=2 RepID=UPI00098F63A2|nr:hypothetical protein [Arthrobacter sp. KBS0703]TSE17548.1 hypothetical protein B1A87_018910 [Arthrobacter sp. KBS0703]